MKCKKILSITLVAFLLITTISAVASARFSIKSIYEEQKFDDIGTVLCPKSDSSLLTGVRIKGEEGTYYNGKFYNLYRPINLPEEFKKDGIKVKFTATVAPIFASILCKFFNTLPIKIIDIDYYEEPQVPLLELNIKVREQYTIEEPIILIATLTNVGREVIKLCDIRLESGTLDLFIIYGDISSVKPVHYIGPTKLPTVEKLGPQESLQVEYNLKDFSKWFGKSNAEYVNQEFRFEEGKYQIKGVYTSFDPHPELSSDINNDIWKGKIESPLQGFQIVLK